MNQEGLVGKEYYSLAENMIHFEKSKEQIGQICKG